MSLPISAPAGIVPAQALYASQDGGITADPVTATNPLQVGVDGVVDGLTTVETVTATGVAVAMPTAGFAGGSFQIIGAFSSCTVNFEQSNDSTNGNDGTWKNLLVRDSTYASPSTNYVNSATMVEFICSAKWVRARVSAYGTGPLTVALTQKRFVEPLLVNALLNTGNAFIGNTNNSSGWLDSTTALAANNNVLGTARATSSYGPMCYFGAFAYADVAGTLYIDWTCDGGTTWQVLDSVAVGAGTTQRLKVPIPAFAANVSLRVRYVNGPAAQGAFRLASAFYAN